MCARARMNERVRETERKTTNQTKQKSLVSYARAIAIVQNIFLHQDTAQRREAWLVPMTEETPFNPSLATMPRLEPSFSVTVVRTDGQLRKRCTCLGWAKSWRGSTQLPILTCFSCRLGPCRPSRNDHHSNSLPNGLWCTLSNFSHENGFSPLRASDFV